MLPFTERFLVDRSHIIPVVLDPSLDILIECFHSLSVFSLIDRVLSLLCLTAASISLSTFVTNFRIILAVYNDTFKICAVDWFPCEHELAILSRRRHGVQNFFYELGTP